MPSSYRTAMSDAVLSLQQAKSLIVAEMRDYPTPISGCDAQFNHLLGERQRITAALDALAQPVFVATPRHLTPEAAWESR